MKVHHAEIVISAVAPQQYPESDLPEVALAGRSNVGKSSFINTLIDRKNLARTSGKPGKTQTLNFYLIENVLHFVDVPGYGYAKVSKMERAKWGKMIETYLTTRKQLRTVIALVDLRHKPTQEDVQMYEFLKYYGISVIVVATKADKIPRGKWNKHESEIKKALNFDDDDQFLLFSSVTKQGKDEAWRAIEEAIADKA
ncbi:ribosome biogenesis GTP-binding protein YihA/YsxC [Enterococcus ratti]|uniref:ribosome biogenesis GTP-binding protein YihA/YsxC n=1 Tax=Enterococcus ratti TaxID=150033 RepID=UPI003514E065